jgi:hypothetical protein
MNPRRPIFDELDHRLSFIQRWSIVPTIQKQNVAMHVHNVVRITWRISVSWLGLTHDELLTAIMWAHHHDDDESISGDIQAPAKMYFDKDSFEADHESHFDIRPPEKIEHIVKLADRMEWIYFLKMEMAMGNQFIENQLLQNKQKLLIMAKDRFNPDIRNKVEDWIVNIDMKSQNFNKRW